MNDEEQQLEEQQLDRSTAGLPKEEVKALWVKYYAERWVKYYAERWEQDSAVLEAVFERGYHAGYMEGVDDAEETLMKVARRRGVNIIQFGQGHGSSVPDDYFDPAWKSC